MDDGSGEMNIGRTVDSASRATARCSDASRHIATRLPEGGDQPSLPRVAPADRSLERLADHRGHVSLPRRRRQRVVRPDRARPGPRSVPHRRHHRRTRRHARAGCSPRTSSRYAASHCGAPHPPAPPRTPPRPLRSARRWSHSCSRIATDDADGAFRASLEALAVHAREGTAGRRASAATKPWSSRSRPCDRPPSLAATSTPAPFRRPPSPMPPPP